MRAIDQKLLAHYLPKLLKGACASTVHRSGSEGMRVNCFTTKFPKGSDVDLVLLEIDGVDVKGLRYDGTKYADVVSVPLATLDPSQIRVTHYYGLDEIRYEGVRAVAGKGIHVGRRTSDS